MDLYVKVSPSISSMIGLNTIERYTFLNGFCVCHGGKILKYDEKKHGAHN